MASNAAGLRRSIRLLARLGAVVALLLLGFAYGFLAHRNRVFPYSAVVAAIRQAREWALGTTIGDRGWGAPPPAPLTAGVTPGMDPKEIGRLQTLGYLQGYTAASENGGVRFHDPVTAQPGLNLYVSGHRPEATIMNMDGEVLHTWHRAFQDVWPERYEAGNQRQQFWRRVRLLPDGGLLAIFDYEGLIRLDAESNLLWSRPEGYHHDLSVTEDGSIYVLGQHREIVPRIHEDFPLVVDHVSMLTSEGRELGRFSILEAFENSPYASVLENARGLEIERLGGDVFHTNTLKILDGSVAERSPVFDRGNLLVSLAHLNVIAIIDPRLERVVWSLSGMWISQHEPVLLRTGNMLLFDNWGHHGMSKVIEFDPFTQSIVWAYEGSEANQFHSTCCGSNQRLANGNTLITDTTRGRAFEVTPDGSVVWEFVNPNRTGRNDELVAVLMDVMRLPIDDPRLAWLMDPPPQG